jgi:molybdopterin-containing oxidoreductase family iron-sulfur binding subunit
MSNQENAPLYWQSLEERSGSERIEEARAMEFPGYDPDELVNSSRRSFLKVMGASMALAGVGGLGGCRRWPRETLVPNSSNPRERIPGVPESFATSIQLNGYGHPVVATSFDGRPIKLEGNHLHPMSRTVEGRIGGTTVHVQATILDLYDPDRSRGVIDRTGDRPKASSWDAFAKAFSEAAGGGNGLAILSERSASPSVQDMKGRLLAKFPGARWFEWEPLADSAAEAGSTAALGGRFRTFLHLDKATTVVLLDADVLGLHPAQVRYSNDWSKLRISADAEEGAPRMSRVYVADAGFSLTGALADERLGVRPSRLLPLAVALAARLGVEGMQVPSDLTAMELAWVDRAAADLQRDGSSAVVEAGGASGPEVHAICHAINARLGALGSTVELIPCEPAGDPLAGLVEAIRGGSVQSLLILGGNSVFDAPADLNLAEALKTVPFKAHLSYDDNETSRACSWHLPRAHDLEAWGDARSWDGTISVAQPLILPMFDGKSVIELLAMVCGDELTSGAEIVRRTFASYAGTNDEKTWKTALHNGLVDVARPGGQAVPQVRVPAVSLPSASSEMEVRFVPDTRLLDGRFANNAWLQECPDTLTKLTWDNAALISVKDARRLNVTTGDVVKVTVDGRSVEIAAYVLPGQPVGLVSLPLGFGRKFAGSVGSEVGVDVYPLRTSRSMWSTAGAQVARTGRTYKLISTQDHHLIDAVGIKGRTKRVGEKGDSGYVIREARFADYAKDPHAPHSHAHKLVTLQLFNPPHQFNQPHAWGMAIDMNACTGCNACVVACQAENNIPSVGKEQVAVNREMHWIRIDRYFKHDPKSDPDIESPDVVYQPMMCVHCENAPCEQVCPVAATVHDTEGLNTMVYNRCIGTRYCSNNCPYKVRRFNYFDYHSNGARSGRFPLPWPGMPDSQQKNSIDQLKQMVFNPEVTVRMRGVMEKCTYCVQRIHTKTIEKRALGQTVADYEVVTACQQVCPTQAIVFGNLNDPEAHVTKLHKNARAYLLLDELNSRPRGKHLAKIRNPSLAGGGKPGPAAEG